MSSTAPGKDALIRWVQAVSPAILPDRLQLFTTYVRAGEYIVGIEDFLANVRPAGWSDDQIDLVASQFVQACQLVASDPHPST